MYFAAMLILGVIQDKAQDPGVGARGCTTIMRNP